MARMPSALLLLCITAAAMARHASAATAAASTEPSLGQSNMHMTRRMLQPIGGPRPSTSRSTPAPQQQSLVPARPQCVWSLRDEICGPTIDNWLMYTGMPASPYTRAQLVAHTREVHCRTTHTNKEACWKDRANRCWWRNADGRQLCRSADEAEVTLYATVNFTASILAMPYAMMCPGSKAAEFFSCFAHPDPAGSCGYLSQCYSTKLDNMTNCFPTWMRGYSQQEFEQLVDSLRAFDPVQYGNCASVCWMKQARQCLLTSSKVECDSLPNCYWGSGTCLRSFVEPADQVGDYGRKVIRLYRRCEHATTQPECESFTAPQASRASTWQTTIDWKSYVAPATGVVCRM